MDSITISRSSMTSAKCSVLLLSIAILMMSKLNDSNILLRDSILMTMFTEINKIRLFSLWQKLKKLTDEREFVLLKTLTKKPISSMKSFTETSLLNVHSSSNSLQHSTKYLTLKVTTENSKPLLISPNPKVYSFFKNLSLKCISYNSSWELPPTPQNLSKVIWTHPLITGFLMESQEVARLQWPSF